MTYKIESPVATQRRWMFEDFDDGYNPQLPERDGPVTPTYVKVSSDNFRDFVGMSDDLRTKALSCQKKRTDSSSARIQRKRSILDSVKGILLDADHDANENISSPVRCYKSDGDLPIVGGAPPRQRFGRRGSCTKYSLEADLSSRREEEKEDVPYPSSPNGYNNSTFSPTRTFKPSQPMTIDMLPVPRRMNKPRSDFPTSFGTRSATNSPVSGGHTRRMPNLCLTDTVVKQGYLAKKTRESPTSRRNSCVGTTINQNTTTKQTISSMLPSAPFANNSNHSKVRMADNSDHSRRRMTDNSDHSRNPVEREQPAKSSNHDKSTTSSKQSRGGAPKLGMLLKRLNITRQDSDRSFADEEEDDAISCSRSVDRTSARHRVPRRNSITATTMFQQPEDTSSNQEFESPSNKNGKYARRTFGGVAAARRPSDLSVDDSPGNSSRRPSYTSAGPEPSSPRPGRRQETASPRPGKRQESASPRPGKRQESASPRPGRRNWRPSLNKREKSTNSINTVPSPVRPPRTPVCHGVPRTPRRSSITNGGGCQRRQEIVGLPGPPPMARRPSHC